MVIRRDVKECVVRLRRSVEREVELVGRRVLGGGREGGSSRGQLCDFYETLGYMRTYLVVV